MFEADCLDGGVGRAKSVGGWQSWDTFDVRFFFGGNTVLGSGRCGLNVFLEFGLLGRRVVGGWVVEGPTIGIVSLLCRGHGKPWGGGGCGLVWER